MTLLDLFRAQKEPEWRHPEPSVRTEAVLRLPSAEQDTLASIARTDESPQVRRAAVRKLEPGAVLVEIARTDADADVRDEAADALVRAAVADTTGRAGELALSVLSDARHLSALSRQAKLPVVRHAALARLTDPRALAQLAREADDAPIRKEALSRIDDPALFAGVAMGSPYKDVALLALERVEDPETLRMIADRARAKAAARRARGKFDVLTAKSTPVEDPEDKAARVTQALCERLEALSGSEDWEQVARALDDADAARSRPLREEHETRLGSAAAALQSRLDTHARERAEQRRQEQARTEARNARMRVCESVEDLHDSEVPERLEVLRQEWDAMAPLPDDDGSLTARFTAAAASASGRHAAWIARAGVVAEQETACVDAEHLADLEDAAEAKRGWIALDQRWAQLVSAAAPEEAVAARFRAAGERLKRREGEGKTAERQREKANRTRIQELCGRLEALVAATPLSYRDADVALREAREAVDAMPALPSRKDQETLAARLRDARQKLFPRFQELKQDQEWKRWANASVQEDLCTRAESLLETKDIEAAARALRDLDAAWKAAADVPREKAEGLWERFKTARDKVKSRCDAYFAKRDTEWSENAQKRETLCGKAEALAESSDWLKTAQEIQALQTEWKTIGPTSRAQSKVLWDRFHAACDRFFTRRQEDRRKRKDDSSQALARKHALHERAEALSTSTDWEATAAEIKKLQAEWKGAGHVSGKAGEEIWERFRATCQVFFERYAKRGDLDRVANVAAREALCAELEGLAPGEGTTAPEDVAGRLAALQAAWKAAPSIPDADAARLNDRFAAARNALILSHPDAFAGTELDPTENRKKLERLCEKVEALVASLAGPSAGGAASGVEALAERLRSGLAQRAMGGKAAAEEQFRAASETFDGLRTAWSRAGTVPGPAGAELTARFEAACRRFRAAKPSAR